MLSGDSVGVYTVRPDGLPAPDNATGVSDNVYRLGDERRRPGEVTGVQSLVSTYARRYVR